MTIFVASFPLEYLFLKNAKASRGVISFYCNVNWLFDMQI